MIVTSIALVLLYFFVFTKNGKTYLDNETLGCPKYICRGANSAGNNRPYRLVEADQIQIQDSSKVVKTILI